jgi:SAM-dependent methyltransferase
MDRKIKTESATAIEADPGTWVNTPDGRILIRRPPHVERQRNGFEKLGYWIGRLLGGGPSVPSYGKGRHFTRYVMYDRLRTVVARTIGEHGGAGMKALTIGGSAPFATQIGLDKADVLEAGFPQYNMLDLPFSDDQFDLVLSDQVLEHVEGDPFAAVRETVRVARPGGYIIHTTCFFNEIHGSPYDFWRFTPEALRLLCRGVAEPIEVDGWGNLALLPLNWLGMRFRPIPSVKWHPLHRITVRNNPLWPITTWLVARKPGP